jgi:Uma2 family endonuclease
MVTPMQAPRRHRLCVDDYYRMAEVGILRPDERVELIEGEIIDVPPPGSLHAGTVDELAEALRAAVGRKALLRVQSPIRLNEYSEPQPDLALLRPRADYYKSAHPGPADVLLIVEVAQSSLAYDRDVKLPLYARHGVPEVWLLDLEHDRLIRHRGPRENGFEKVDGPKLGQPLELSALPGIRATLPRRRPGARGRS